MTTFPAGEQTRRAALPQQPALEPVRADTPGSRDEKAHGHPATVRGTGREHGRGKTGGQSTRARRRHAKSAATMAQAAENGNGDAPPHDSPPYQGGVGASRVLVHPRRAVRGVPGSRVRGCDRAVPRAGPRRRSHRTRLLHAYRSGPVRIPSAPEISYQPALRLHHRRSRAGECAERPVGGHTDGTCPSACEGPARPQDADGTAQRPPLEPADPSAGRRVRLLRPAGGPAVGVAENRLIRDSPLPKVWATGKEVVRSMYAHRTSEVAAG